MAPKSSQNREKERLRSTLGNHPEKGNQKDEKKSLPKMKNRAFLMEGCSKSHFQLTATTWKNGGPEARIWRGFWSQNRLQIEEFPFQKRYKKSADF